MRGFSLGQYYPAESPIHALDVRLKLLLSVAYIVCIFFADNIVSYILCLGICLGIAALARIPVRMLLKSMRPIIFIVIFTSFFNIFWTAGEVLLTPEGFFIKIYLEGIVAAFYMVIRIISLVTGSLVLMSFTTTPIALTYGIESLLSPLAKIKVPVHDFAMMMSIALRFIPTLMEETEKIVNAQKARGADLENGNLVKRAKAFIPILVPLIVSAFRRADELATAMECRCYNGSPDRTRLRVLKISASDIFLFVLGLCACALLILSSTGVGIISLPEFIPAVLR